MGLKRIQSACFVPASRHGEAGPVRVRRFVLTLGDTGKGQDQRPVQQAAGEKLDLDKVQVPDQTPRP